MTTPAVGVDLGATKVLFTLVDDAGRILRSKRVATEAGRGPDHVIQLVIAGVGELLDGSGAADQVVGIGVAAQVNRDGVVRFAPNLKWVDRPLRSEVEAGVNRPVRVLNDARAAAVGEWRFGAGRGVSDLVCLFLGTGLGGGVVTGGRLLEGASNGAGELGHLTIVTGGRRCTCHARGCLEAYVGGWAIAERALEAALARPADGRALQEAERASSEGLTAREVIELATRGDPLSREIMAETQRHLSAGLVGIVNAFNPSLIVAGGGVLEGAPSLFPKALEDATPSMLPSLGEVVRGAPAALGPDAVAVGAAEFARGGHL